MAYGRRPSSAYRLLTIAASALWISCGTDPGGLSAPTTGSIEITTTTSGPVPDEDGYTVVLDGADVQAIGVAAVVTLTELEAGTHLVGLGGVAANCQVQGDNPRGVAVVAGETAVVEVSVVCEEPPPTVGGLRVTTATGGVSPDPDGYTVSVDGGPAVAIGVTASVAIPDVTPGDHLVALAGVAANCTVSGENPRPVTVPAGAVAPLQFDVACVEAPASTGTISITTVSTGPTPDPDGYAFQIDDGPEQPIGVNATASVANLAEGPHAIRLTGLAANCSLEGLNPREATVTAGGTIEVTFALDCQAATGTLSVTTTTSGSPADPDGYAVSVDAAAPVPIGASGTVAIADLAPGPHSVALSGLAANCKVQGDNPRSATVAAAATANVTFSVACAATTGSLAITITGLPAGAAAAVSVTGPGGFFRVVPASETLDGLAPGQYTLRATGVNSGAEVYGASPEEQTVSVTAGAAAEARIAYAPPSAPSLNLYITGLNITQSVQTFDNKVPLIAGRDGFLRVFVLASEANTATPNVRVRLYDGGSLIQTLSIPAPRASVPTKREEGVLDASWNLPIPSALIRPGLQFLADVDPENTVGESNEEDNNFPANGSRRSVTVRNATRLGITLVPVRQKVSGLQGDVSDANRDAYLGLTQALFPLPGYDATVHAVYTSTFDGALQPDDGNFAWNAILSEIEALRVAEGAAAGHHYYGVVRTGYGSGLVGLGYVGLPSAIGYDDPLDRDRITAHELGHNWERLHAPCGNPGGADQQYPYTGGQIGQYGFDLRVGALKNKTTPDVMSYCESPWVSDYTYGAVREFRASSGATAVRLAALEQPSLLVWGRIVNGRAVLEPAFQVVTRPVLPSGPGPYSIEVTTSDGARATSLSFDAAAVADDPRGGRHFAFAIPLDPAVASRLGSVRVTGPGVGMAEVGRSMAALRAAPATAATASAAAGGVAVRWDAATHPMVMVRDAETGEVLSFARGGEVVLPTGKGEVDLVMSDGVRSRYQRMRVSGR